MNKFDLDSYGITPADIKDEVDILQTKAQEDSNSTGLFISKSTNEWIEEAKKRPIPRMLFSELWYEGELCILYADTNVGKSILAVQICDSITKGKPISGFKLEAERQPVIYFDFEMSDKQLENRYSIEFEEHYEFDENFIRVEINPDADVPDDQSYEDFLSDSLERTIVARAAKIVIIDNLTYLRNETEKSKDASPLMKRLKALKVKYNLSLLILAHTPKRDPRKEITRNDLQGSRMLMNFCDSAFAVGESHTDKGVRYIKQIKARNTEYIYDASHVCECRINKMFNFLRFEFIKYGNERDYLKAPEFNASEADIQRMVELKKEGKSLRAIATEFNTNHTQIKRTLDAWEEWNEVEQV